MGSGRQKMATSSTKLPTASASGLLLRLPKHPRSGRSGFQKESIGMQRKMLVTTTQTPKSPVRTMRVYVALRGQAVRKMSRKRRRTAILVNTTLRLTTNLLVYSTWKIAVRKRNC